MAARKSKMKHAIKRGAQAIHGFRKSRPREFRWSIYGIVVGALVGAFVGGVGVAALGSALGVPASVILATSAE